MKKLWSIITALLIVVVGLVLARFMEAGAMKLPIRQYFPTNTTISVWDWTDPANRSAADLKNINSFLYLHQINRVYLDVSPYADIYQKSDGQAKQRLQNALAAYVNAVKGNHVKVYASAGNTDWSKPSERQIPLAIQKFVFDYNASHQDAKLSGIEYDIESYNQTDFPEASVTEKTIVLSELLNTVQALTAKQKQLMGHYHDQLDLGFAIPYWFDNENGNIPSITWNGKTGPTLYHLVDTINQLPSANVVVMAYRNAAMGNDGTIFHSRTEVEYAQAKASHVKVLIGQEVNDVQPAKITFYGMGISTLSTEVNIINDNFKDNSGFGGVAINDLKGLQQMDAPQSTASRLYIKL